MSLCSLLLVCFQDGSDHPKFMSKCTDHGITLPRGSTVVPILAVQCQVVPCMATRPLGVVAQDMQGQAVPFVSLTSRVSAEDSITCTLQVRSVYHGHDGLYAESGGDIFIRHISCCHIGRAFNVAWCKSSHLSTTRIAICVWSPHYSHGSIIECRAWRVVARAGRVPLGFLCDVLDSRACCKTQMCCRPPACLSSSVRCRACLVFR